MDDVTRTETDAYHEDDGEPIVFTPREREMIAEAEESAAQRGTIPGDEVLACLDSLFTSNPLPTPERRKHA